MTMETYAVLSCIIVFSLWKVEGWPCGSQMTKVFKRVNTDAMLKFDLSGDINSQTVNTLTVKYHDNSIRAAIGYNNGGITYSTVSGVDVSADLSGNIVFTIQNVEAENAGVYYITSKSTPTKCNCLYILGTPQIPTISVDNPSVGGRATLLCSSTSTTSPSNHSLGLTFSWEVDNIDNPSGPRYAYSTNRDTLTLSNIVKEDANKQFTCTATEDVTGAYTSRPSGSEHLNVLYGPENIDFSPSTTRYDKAENTSLSPVTCSANCNPACSFKWIKVLNSTVVSNNAVLNLSMMSPSKAGTYRCTATRSGGSSVTKDLTVNVIYGPYNSLLSPSTPEYTRNENGTNLPNISCSADCYPCSYTWIKSRHGERATIETRNGILSLGLLSREDAGNYTCDVTNQELSSTTSISIRVNVRYGPDKAQINIKSPHHVTEGEVPKFRCSSDCYPRCLYSWINATSGLEISSVDVLSLGPVTRYMAGIYKCTVSNTAASEYRKSAENSTTVIVRYAPEVSVAISPLNTTEGANVTLFCIGHGVPSEYHYTRLTQTVNGIKIRNTNEGLMGTEENSSIHFSSLRLEDTGLYTCELNNNVTTASGVLDQTGSVNVTVTVRPKILSGDLRYTGVTNGMAEVEMRVYSFPELDSVTVTRYNDVDIVQDDKYSFSTYNAIVETNFYGTSVNLNGKIFNMTIKDLVEQDFGNYSITFRNGIGTQVVQISIIAEGPPSPPEKFQLLSEQSNPIIFIWEKKFNGGQSQRFIIQTTPVGADQWTNHTNINETDSQYKLNATFYKAEIKLQPGIYNARILSSNVKGESVVVPLGHNIEIKEEKGPPSLQVGAIAGGSVSVVVVIAIVAVVAVVVRRKTGIKGDNKSRLKMSLTNDVDEAKDEDEVTINPMYVSADEVPPADNTYAQPVKKKKIVEADSVYAMVDKKTKAGKKDASIYENAEDFSSQERNKKMPGKCKTHKESQHTSDTTKSQRIVNKDGLVYVDLVFNDQRKSKKKLVIHGRDNTTNYVEVDFSKKAEPLPPSDEEDNTTK